MRALAEVLTRAPLEGGRQAGTDMTTHACVKGSWYTSVKLLSSAGSRPAFSSSRSRSSIGTCGGGTQVGCLRQPWLPTSTADVMHSCRPSCRQAVSSQFQENCGHLIVEPQLGARRDKGV